MSNKRTARIPIVLKEKRWITPNFIRGVFTSDDLEQFANTSIGDNNKIFIPPVGVKEIHFSTIDESTGITTYPPDAIKPTLRTYTHRHLDLEKKELYIDFVNHGDEGLASAWINKAEPGDLLGVAMRLDAKEIYNTTAQNYILLGDATAIPVLGAILESLPESAFVTCIIEVKTLEDKQNLHTKAHATFHWLYNATPENGSELVQQLKQLELPNENRFAYVAAEFSTVKNARHYLRKECGWSIDELYAYAYWRAGFAESESVSDRKSEKENN